jgi:hypothetical protein
MLAAIAQGETLGQYINQGRAQMQASVNAGGSFNGEVLTTFASIARDYGQIDFKNGAAGRSVFGRVAQSGIYQDEWVPHLRRSLIATKVGHRAEHDPSFSILVIWTGEAKPHEHRRNWILDGGHAMAARRSSTAKGLEAG